MCMPTVCTQEAELGPRQEATDAHMARVARCKCPETCPGSERIRPKVSHSWQRVLEPLCVSSATMSGLRSCPWALTAMVHALVALSTLYQGSRYDWPSCPLCDRRDHAVRRSSRDSPEKRRARAATRLERAELCYTSRDVPNFL